MTTNRYCQVFFHRINGNISLKFIWAFGSARAWRPG